MKMLYWMQKKFRSKKWKYGENVNCDDRDIDFFFFLHLYAFKGLEHSYFAAAAVLIILRKTKMVLFTFCLSSYIHMLLNLKNQGKAL